MPEYKISVSGTHIQKCVQSIVIECSVNFSDTMVGDNLARRRQAKISHLEAELTKVVEAYFPDCAEVKIHKV